MDGKKWGDDEFMGSEGVLRVVGTLSESSTSNDGAETPCRKVFQKDAKVENELQKVYPLNPKFPGDRWSPYGVAYVTMKSEDDADRTMNIYNTSM